MDQQQESSINKKTFSLTGVDITGSTMKQKAKEKSSGNITLNLKKESKVYQPKNTNKAPTNVKDKRKDVSIILI
ncbi:MAG: hypothetical protein MJ252_19555 [archaeon]|nr:hypothetical protein [archaeon]